MTDIPVKAGASWKEISGNLDLPEHIIMRLGTYFGALGPDDLVHTKWMGDVVGGFERGEVLERLVIVGQDGAGRPLRRRDFAVTATRLSNDVPAIYLCALPKDQNLKYAFVDCAEDSKPVLVCRRDDFERVYAELKMAGSGRGQVWKGSHLLDSKEWLKFDEAAYVFDAALLQEVIDNTIAFLGGDFARRLREWGVSPKRAVLLHGRPGNGKTILTRLAAKRALQTEINVVFLDVDLIRDIGEQLRLAATRAPVLIIIDDLDVHCGPRTSREPDRGTSQRNSTLAHLLEFLDGVEPIEGFSLLATAAGVECLDEALVRSGRLEVHVEMKGPNANHRRDLLERALQVGGKASPQLDRAIALLEGCSYANLAEFAKRYKIAVCRTGSLRVDQSLFDSVVESYARELKAVSVRPRAEGQDPD